MVQPSGTKIPNEWGIWKFHHTKSIILCSNRSLFGTDCGGFLRSNSCFLCQDSGNILFQSCYHLPKETVVLRIFQQLATHIHAHVAQLEQQLVHGMLANSFCSSWTIVSWGIPCLFDSCLVFFSQIWLYGLEYSIRVHCQKSSDTCFAFEAQVPIFKSLEPKFCSSFRHWSFILCCINFPHYCCSSFFFFKEKL